MRDSKLFGELRAHLARPPNEGIFHGICELLGDGDIDSRTLEYLLDHLERWPETVVRAPPFEWIWGLIEGRPPPALALCTYLAVPHGAGGLELVDRIASCPHLTQLRALRLPGDGLGPEAARALVDSRHLRRVRVLVLRKNRLRDEGAQVLADSEMMGQLVSLDLGLNGIGDRGALALANSPQASSLERLFVPQNDIGLEGAYALERSAHLPRLSLLALEGNPRCRELWT